MKKQLRLVSLIVGVLMLCSMSMVSCAEPTTFEIVNDAIVKTQALDSMHAVSEMNMDMKMDLFGMSVPMEIPMKMDIKASGLQGDNPVMNMGMSLEMMDEEIAFDSYLEGEYLYISVMGENMKVKSEEMGSMYDARAQIDGTVQQIPEELLTDIVAVEKSDGSKAVNLTIPQDQLQTLYGDLLESVQGTAAEGSPVSNLVISDAEVEVVINKDGYVSVYALTFGMDMTVGEGEEAIDCEIDVEMKITYQNPGEPVTVTPPEGYRDFPEVDADDVGL